MPSKLNRETIRQNEAKAAGFRTPQGIETSSTNALRHQFTSQTQVLANACPDKSAEFPKIYIERFQPQVGVEMSLVDEMVAARWHQQFRRIIQTTLIDLQMENREVEVRSELTKALYPLREQQNLRNDPKPARPPRHKSAEFPKIYIERFQPQVGVEMNLVDEMVVARWRQQFGRIIQTTLIDLQMEHREVEVRSERINALYRLREKQNLRNDPKPAPPSHQKSSGNFHQTATSRPAQASKRSRHKRPSGNTAADPDRFRTFTRRDRSIDKIKSAEYAKQESGENFSMHQVAPQSKLGGERRLC